MKKILIIGFELGGLGGTETVCRKFHDLISDKAKVNFLFFKQDKKNVDNVWLNNTTHKTIECHVRNTPLRRFSFSFMLSREIARTKPDIIIAIDAISCYIANTAKKMTLVKPTIYSWIHLSLFSAYKAKFVLKAEKHLSISNGNSDYLIENGVNKDNINTIFNPFTRSNIVINRDIEYNFLFMGRVLAGEGKNLNEMFNALSLVKGTWKLHIIGDGDDVQQLKELSNKLNIEKNIIWHGWIRDPWNYISNHIHSVSALLLTSTNEGFPMVLGEAISHGIYCISSDCKTGTTDIINDNNGSIYKLGNIEELSFKLQEIIDKKELPPHDMIIQSINHIYDEEYKNKIIKVLKI